MNIQRLKYFIRLAETLNFTKAASDCFIVQTAMSRQISALENELGVTLFLRNTHQVKLTPAGQEFYWHAIKIVGNYEHALERVLQVAQKADVSLRIGIGPYEQILLTPVLKQFVEKYPDVQLLLEQYNYEHLAKSFMEGAYDALVCIDHCADRVKGCATICVYDGDWGVICGRHSELYYREHVTVDDLRGQPLINMSEYNIDFYRVHMNNRIAPSKYIHANSFASKVSMVQAGIGIAWVPQFTVEALPSDVRYIRIPPDGRNRRFVFAYQPDRVLNSAFYELVDMVKAYYSSDSARKLAQ